LISRRKGLVVLVASGLTLAVIALFLTRIPQPLSYHNFADHRAWLGISNFGDVSSNLPFAIVGAWGLAWLVRPRAEDFLISRERWPYLMVFAGLLLTAFGSSYYHLDPNNARLVWDRLPITMVFTSLVAAMIAERFSVRAGVWFLPVLVALGMASVVQWYSSELHGAGDLRLYAAVQVYSALVLLIALLLPPRYTHGSDLGVVVAFYALAKLLETFDRPIFNLLNGTVSGHTLKHLAAAMAGYWILRMLQKRTPISGRLEGSQV
jgi:hypothetical protein